MALRVRADALGCETGVDVREIGRVSQLVSQLTGYGVQRNKAIVGANAFAHEAGIHQDGMLKDARDVPDHGSGGARPDDDAAARQALGPARVPASVRAGRECS